MDASAEDCISADNKAWECSNSDTIEISPVTSALKGSPPEIGVSIYLVTDNGPPQPLQGNRLPADYKAKLNDKFIIEYTLINGMAQSQLNQINQKLKEGFFDIDGDPIDQIAIYESIQWTLSDAANPSFQKNPKSEIRNEFVITAEHCQNPYTIGFKITPYTHTGTPNSGSTKSVQIFNHDNTLFTLTNCILPLREENLKLVITHKQNTSGKVQTYIDERTIPVEDTSLITPRPGDIFTASLWILEGNEWVDVTESFKSTFIWGYQTDSKDVLIVKGGSKVTTNKIWMDGSQNAPQPINTKGQTTYQVQNINSNAKISPEPNLSEQGMKLIFKYEFIPEEMAVAKTK